MITNRVCLHYALNKPGKCPYGKKCIFLHSEDWGYKEALKYWSDYQKYFKEIQDLHTRRWEIIKSLKEIEADKYYNAKKPKILKKLWNIENEINKRAVSWDNTHPRGPNCYNMRFMTKVGAINYLNDITYKTKKEKIGEIFIMTGKGKNSVDGVPEIQQHLLDNYDRNACLLKKDMKNQALLLLTIRKP